MQQLQLPYAKQEFETLQEIGRIFIDMPENLPAVLKEGQLANLDPSFVKQLIKKRADYSSHREYFADL